MKLDSRRIASRGFTLIELLVVIFVLGVLLALLFPAVMSSRQAARRLECSNHLKQIGIALSSHHQSQGAFPAGVRSGGFDEGIGSEVAVDPLSVHYQLLPYIELSPIYDSINVSLGSATAPISTHPTNATSRSMAIEGFLCPADPGGPRTGNNYRASFGALVYEFEGRDRQGAGTFSGFKRLAAHNIRDGLSQTAAFSERVRGSRDEGSWDRFTDIWHSGLNNFVRRTIEADEMIGACDASPGSSIRVWTNAGESWLTGEYADTTYNHVAPPNWSVMDCSIHGPPSDLGDVVGGAVSARSYHGNGVNLLLLDGSARFVIDSVDLNIWRATGTREGGEVKTIVQAN